MGKVSVEAPCAPSPSAPEEQGGTTLTPEGRRMAQRELSEEDHTRALALRQMREWVAANTCIKSCRTDSPFLLRFLRTKKFRVGDAQQLLERYLRMRVEHPTWFRSLDIRNPRLENLIDRGYFFALPQRDDAGRRVFFSVAGCLSPSVDTASDMMRGIHMGLESLLEEEENQVRGFTYIFDERGVGLSVVTLWTPATVSKAFHCSENTTPARHQQIHFVHLSITLYAVFEFAKALLSEKIKKRFQIHSNVDQLGKFVPKRILPREYGGDAPIKSMIASYKKELEAVRSQVLSLDDMEWSKPTKHKKIERLNSVPSLQRPPCRMIEID